MGAKLLVNVLIVAYGEPVLLNRKIKDLQNWISQNNFGMVREVRILDVPIKREAVEKLKEYLNPSHPSITSLIKNKFIQLFLKQSKYNPYNDVRYKNFHSPNFNIIGIRQDNTRPNGKESVG